MEDQELPSSSFISTAAGLCWVELETVRRKWEASVQRAGLGCRCWRLMWVWAWPWLVFFLAEVGSSVVVSLRFAFSQNQGKGKALVFSCAGRGKSWVEKGEETTVGGGAAALREEGKKI
jgi:hypothetical protein